MIPSFPSQHAVDALIQTNKNACQNNKVVFSEVLTTHITVINAYQIAVQYFCCFLHCPTVKTSEWKMTMVVHFHTKQLRTETCKDYAFVWRTQNSTQSQNNKIHIASNSKLCPVVQCCFPTLTRPLNLSVRKSFEEAFTWKKWYEKECSKLQRKSAVPSIRINWGAIYKFQYLCDNVFIASC